jgi:hypothetical protein
MTKDQLQALLEDTQSALNEALKGLGQIVEITKGVDHHPQAPMEKTAPYAIGSIGAAAAHYKMIAELRAAPARF